MKQYISDFLKLNCASDMLELKLFPRNNICKEITESQAAYHAVKNHLLKQCDISLNDPNNVLIAVGDGNTPRTAALFAFRSKWKCFSVDPRLKEEYYPIKRLSACCKKIEDCFFGFQDGKWGHVIVVLVHNHAPMKAILGSIKAKPGKLHIVAIPCCVPQNIPGKTYIGYTDVNIWSPKNEVRIWQNL
ncbi:MAG: hypothetical protein Q8M94_14575 [Ignavibacteria bacterium]|nr:hypothetical protein [Ignavibacteria bacterium]